MSFDVHYWISLDFFLFFFFFYWCLIELRATVNFNFPTLQLLLWHFWPDTTCLAPFLWLLVVSGSIFHCPPHECFVCARLFGRITFVKCGTSLFLFLTRRPRQPKQLDAETNFYYLTITGNWRRRRYFLIYSAGLKYFLPLKYFSVRIRLGLCFSLPTRIFKDCREALEKGCKAALKKV